MYMSNPLPPVLMCMRARGREGSILFPYLTGPYGPGGLQGRAGIGRGRKTGGGGGHGLSIC